MAPPARRVYVDHAATTPMRPEALAATCSALSRPLGNPSGGHAAARAAAALLDEAREQIAGHLGAAAGEVVLTAGGTEADNLAVLGAARAARELGRGDGVVVSALEHKAVLAPAARLARDGFRVHRAPVSADGVVDLDALADALDERTVLVAVMSVSNEVGTVQPLADAARVVRERAPRAVLHVDAVQGAPWLDVVTAGAPADLLAISAHKLGGPAGAGALVVRRGTPLAPLLEGGGQERGRRAGTPSVAAAVGLAAALGAVDAERTDLVARVGALRTRLVDGIGHAVPNVRVHGAGAPCVPGIAAIEIEGVEAEALLVALDRAGVCASSGSSCSSGAAEPSHVLRAIGRPDAAARSTIRLSLGWPSTDADVDAVLDALPVAVHRLRSFAGVR